MNWNRVEYSWKQMTGKMKAHWDKVTGGEFTVVDGQEFVNRTQEQYRAAKGEARCTRCAPP